MHLKVVVVVVVSLLSHFWLIHFFHLRLLYQPYLGLCQAPCVQSNQRQPMSAVAITACEVQVSAADSQTVPTVVTGVSKPLCCRLTLTFTLTSENLSLCITLLLLLLLVLIQLCSPRCWHLDSNYCRTRCRQSQLRFVLSSLLLHPRLLETFQSDIPLFTLTWPTKPSLRNIGHFVSASMWSHYMSPILATYNRRMDNDVNGVAWAYATVTVGPLLN